MTGATHYGCGQLKFQLNKPTGRPSLGPENIDFFELHDAFLDHGSFIIGSRWLCRTWKEDRVWGWTVRSKLGGVSPSPPGVG